MEDLADVAVGLRPDELVAPGLLDAIGEVRHGSLELWIADCGSRIGRVSAHTHELPLRIRNPQSEIRNCLILVASSISKMMVRRPTPSHTRRSPRIPRPR